MGYVIIIIIIIVPCISLQVPVGFKDLLGHSAPLDLLARRATPDLRAPSETRAPPAPSLRGAPPVTWVMQGRRGCQGPKAPLGSRA